MRQYDKQFWIDVEQNNNYEVSNLGNVRNKRTGKILKPLPNREGGYYRVSINNKRHYIHRLVANAFYDGDITGKDVNHIDGDKRNNAIANLEICTRKENIQHAFINGLKFPSSVRVVRCKFCKHRYDYDICQGKEDSFFCANGEH